jgi:hypothetical protein
MSVQEKAKVQCDKHLIRALADKIRGVALCRTLLLAVDGLTSYIDAFQYLAWRAAAEADQRSILAGVEGKTA